MICRFVTSIGGSTTFDLNDKVNYFYLEGSEFPLPEVKYDWVENALNDGARLASWTLGDNKITLNLLIKGTTAAETYQKLQNFLRQVLNEGYLEVSLWGATNSVYYKTRPALPKLPDITKKYVIDQHAVSNIKIEIPVFPRCWTSKVRLDLIKGLGPNDSLELRTADDFTYWAEVVSGGTITANTTDFLTGAVSCKLTTTGGAHTTSLTDRMFIPVDATHHHNAKLYVYKNSGTLTLDHDVICYNDADAVLGTLALLTGYNPTATTWLDAIKLAGSPVINPIGGASPAFAVGTTKVKRQIRHDTTIGVVSLDSLLFEDSEYLVDHEYESACGFQVPVGTALGDLKSLAKVYVTNAGASGSGGQWLAQNSGLATDINDVEAYAADKVWAVGDGGKIQKYTGTAWTGQTNTLATTLNAVSTPDGAKVWAVGDNGVIRYTADGGATAWGAQTFPAATNPVLPDPGFEGTFATYWSTNASQHTTIARSTPHSGTYSLRFQFANDHGYSVPETSSAFGTAANRTTINPLKSYTVKVWCFLDITSSLLDRYIEALFYNSAGTLIGTKTSVAYGGSGSWVQRTLSLAPANYPAGTVSMTVRIRNNGVLKAGAGDADYWDDITIEQVGTPDLFDAHAIATNNIIAVGEWGTIVKSANGTTWSEKVSGTYNTLRAVHAASATQIIAVGDSGTIVTSADGTTWTARVSGTTKHLYGVFGLDATHAWAVGQDGTILFSGDAGATWTAQTSGTVQWLYSVWAADSTHAWAVGDNGTVLFFSGTTWSTKNSGTSNRLNSVEAISATSVWAVGNGSAIIYGLSSAVAFPITNFSFAERDDAYDNWSPVKDALGATQTTLYMRRRQRYRQMAAGTTEKFRWPVESHRGRYLVSIGCSFGAATAYDKITLKYYLEDVEGNKISAVDITPTVLDMGDPNTKFKEIASQTTRLANLSIPTHFIPTGANENNVYQCVEVVANASLATTEWLDEITLIPVDHFIRLSGWVGNAMILDSDDKIVLLSQDGGLDTTAAFDPTKVEGACEFYADPAGMNFTMLATNMVSGDEQLTPKVNITLEYYPAYLLTAE